MAQFYGGYTNIPGAPGNPMAMQGMVAGNPFGADFVIPQKGTTSPVGGPQLGPLPQSPARVFPKDQPGREGAIDVRFRQALGMPNIPGAPGNPAGMANAAFYAGPQFAQLPQNFGFAGKSVYS